MSIEKALYRMGSMSEFEFSLEVRRVKIIHWYLRVRKFRHEKNTPTRKFRREKTASSAICFNSCANKSYCQ